MMCTKRKHSACYYYFLFLILLIFIIYVLLAYDSMIHAEILNRAIVTIPIPNTTLNDTIYTKFKTVIGLGAAKCGSSTMKRLLKLSTPQYLTQPFNKYRYRYIVRGETSYWLSCHRHIAVYIYDSFRNRTGCDLKEYYTKELISSHLAHYLPRYEGQYDHARRYYRYLAVG